MRRLRINQFHIRLILVQSAILMTVLMVFALTITAKFSIDGKEKAYDEISYQGDVLKHQIVLNLNLVETVMNQLAYNYETQRPSAQQWDDQVQYMLRQTPLITQLYLMDVDGMQFYKSSYPETLGSRSDRDYFKKAVQGLANYSDVIVSRSTLKPIVVYAIPIHLNNQIVGVMGASIDLDFLSKLIWAGKAEPTIDARYGFIVDSKGHMIAHPNHTYVENTLDVSDLEPVRAAIGGGRGTGIYHFENQNKLVAYDFMPQTNWGILVQIPERTAYLELRRFQIIVGLTCGVIAVISLIMVFWVSGYFRQPVAEVVQLINLFRVKRTVPMQCSMRDDEFGMIQDAFIEMAETILKDQQELEARVAARTHELTEARAQLVQSEKMAALGRMTSNFAHEVNTPLGTALTVVDLYERSLLELHHVIEAELESSENATELINDLKDMSRLIRKQLITINGLVETMVKTDFVNAFVTESSDLGLKKYLELQLVDLQGLLNGTNHRLEFVMTISDSIDLRYKEKLTQILKILIQNSIQHGFEALESGVIQVTLEETAYGLKLTYKDNGRNIAEDEIKRIFEPYYKGKMSGVGKGLGLTIVYTLVVHFLNGRIQCHNVSPTGLAYEIELPNTANAEGGDQV